MVQLFFNFSKFITSKIIIVVEHFLYIWYLAFRWQPSSGKRDMRYFGTGSDVVQPEFGVWAKTEDSPSEELNTIEKYKTLWELTAAEESQPATVPSNK